MPLGREVARRRREHREQHDRQHEPHRREDRRAAVADRARAAMPSSAATPSAMPKPMCAEPDAASPSRSQNRVDPSLITGAPEPTPYLFCSGEYRWRSSTSARPAEQERGAASAAASRRWPASPWRSVTAANPAISTSSDRSANSPNGCADTSRSVATAYGTPSGRGRCAASTSMSQALRVGRGDHRGVAAGELAQVDHDRRRGRDDRDHRSAGAADQLAAEAVADRHRDDAEQRRGQPQPQDVVPPRERRVHQQVVQRRAVAVVDRDPQHIERRRPRRDAERDALVVVERAEVEPEPDHHDGVGQGGGQRHERRPAGAQETACTVASQHRRGIIRHIPAPADGDPARARCEGHLRVGRPATGYPSAHGI